MEEQEKKKIGYRDVFSQKQYLKMIVANIINRFGDSIDSIALSWLVYELTGSASWSALIVVFNQLPSVLLQPFTGALVEHMNKKRIMVVSDLIRGLLTLLMAILYISGILNPIIIVAYTLICSTVECFRVPAGMSILPSILDKEYYEFGMSASSSLSTVFQMIGLGAAGGVIAFGGIGLAMMIDAGTFFLSGIFILMIRVPKDVKEKVKLTVSTYLETLKEGFRYVISKPVIRNFCIMCFLLNGLITPFSSFQSPLIAEVYHKGSTLLSVMSIMLMVGMFIGSFIFPYVNQSLKNRTIITLSGLLLGFSYMCFIFTAKLNDQIIILYLLVAFFSTLLGFSVSMISSVLSVEFMKQIEQEYLSRAGSIFNSGGSFAVPITAALVSFIARFFTISQIFIVSGALCVILFLAIMIKKVQFE